MIWLVIEDIPYASCMQCKVVFLLPLLWWSFQGLQKGRRCHCATRDRSVVDQEAWRNFSYQSPGTLSYVQVEEFYPLWMSNSFSEFRAIRSLLLMSHNFIIKVPLSVGLYRDILNGEAGQQRPSNFSPVPEMHPKKLTVPILMLLWRFWSKVWIK